MFMKSLRDCILEHKRDGKSAPAVQHLVYMDFIETFKITFSLKLQRVLIFLFLMTGFQDVGF